MTLALTRQRALDDLTAAVASARPHLIDAWEAAALIESFGYTDARIRREFGFSDTAAIGAYVFHTLAGRPRDSIAIGERSDRKEPPVVLSFIDAIGASLVYALPWLVTFLIERVRPDMLRLPGNAGPPLSRRCATTSSGNRSSSASA